MYVGIDPEVAATHRQHVNRQWAETERVRASIRHGNQRSKSMQGAARQHLGGILINLGNRMTRVDADKRTLTTAGS